MSKLLLTTALSIALLSSHGLVQADGHVDLEEQIAKLRQDKQAVSQRLDRAIGFSKNAQSEAALEIEALQLSLESERQKRKTLADRLRRSITYSKQSREQGAVQSEEQQQSMAAEQAKRKVLADRLRRSIAFSKQSREQGAAQSEEQQQSMVAEQAKRKVLADRLRRSIAFSKQSREQGAAQSEEQQQSMAAEQAKRKVLADRLRRSIAFSKQSREQGAIQLDEQQLSIEAEKQKRRALSERLRRAVAFSKSAQEKSAEQLGELETQLATQGDAGARGWAADVSTTLSSALNSEAGTTVRTLSDNSVKILVGNNGLFQIGGTALSPEGTRLISSIARELSGIAADMTVIGYTDNIPVGNNSRFNSNEELSFSRAASTMQVLRDQGITNTRLSAAGFGADSPIATNDTPEGRRQNRRVEIVLKQQ